MTIRNLFPNLGTGLGLRSKYYNEILEGQSTANWFEAISECYMGLNDLNGGRPIKKLEKIRENNKIVLHGVSMSLGSTDPLSFSYLERLKTLVNRIEPEWVSDHLCWTSVGGQNIHDLLPLPYTIEAINHLVNRIDKVQNFLGRRILIENTSSYLEFNSSTMPEWEFLTDIVNKADCGILLDVNNIFVSSANHQYDPKEFINAVPVERIGQIHIAGHTNHQTYLVDTHDEPVSDSVWELLEYTLSKTGPISTMIERDDNFPNYEEIENELTLLKNITNKISRTTCINDGFENFTTAI